MTAVSVIGPGGKAAGKTVELPEEIFAAKVNVPLIHQVVVAQQAAARQGTHATKTRGEVRGGGKKPYRQKGTGRARQGSLRAPQYAGGGTVHGPVPRSYVQRTPKKMKAAALRGALSDRSSHGRVAVVSRFVEGEEPSTSAALTVLRAAVGETGARLSLSVLVVVNEGDELTRKSLRNAVSVRGLINLFSKNIFEADHGSPRAAVRTAASASPSAVSPIDPPSRARASTAASASSAISPPRKYAGFSRPSVRFASVSVGSSPPWP